MAASVVALATPARADDELPTIDSAFPPAVRVGVEEYGSAIDRIAVDIHAASVSWITLEVSNRFARPSVVLLDVPGGTRIVGMALTTRGVRSWSAAQPRREAVASYRRGSDAALLAWEGTSADQDHVRIAVDGTARIEVAVELPPITTLAIDPEGQRVPRIEVTVDGREPRQWRKQARAIALDLHGIEAHVAADAYPHADAQTWLVAGAPTHEEPRLNFRFARPPTSWSDKAAIRRMMKLNTQRFAYCYERVAQFHPELDGEVTIEVLIAADGTVASARATSAFPAEINRCLEGVFTAWEFPAMDVPVLVNYPLRFRLVR